MFPFKSHTKKYLCVSENSNEAGKRNSVSHRAQVYREALLLKHMELNEISFKNIKTAITIHKESGPAFLNQLANHV